MEIDQLYKYFLDSNGISTDSRSIEPGQMFFALSGANFNGNKFAMSALKMGANYAVVDELIEEQNEHIILVENTLKCLQDLAKHHRETLETPIIAITGSNGKTTTKELCQAVLATQYNCHYTSGNLNNHIGVPLTLLELNPKHELAIIEMGANHLNEIKELCQIAQPDYGIITNIGKAHLEGFGSLEGVKKGKGELYDFLKKQDGIIFFNEEDEVLKDLVSTYEQVVIYYPSELETSNTEEGLLNINWKGLEILSNLAGKYNVLNVAAAIAIGGYFKVSNDNIQTALSEYIPTNNRSQILYKDGIEYFLDAYNANPSSMDLSLKNFLTLDGESKVLILGDMLELGHVSEEEHIAVVKSISASDCSKAYVVGEEFGKIKIDDIRIKHFNTVIDLKTFLNTYPLQQESRVLLKGSRGIGLEKILD